MKSTDTKMSRWFLAGACFVMMWWQSAYCQTTGPAILIQQTPANGGTVTPETGLHHFGHDKEVTLTATPNPGYQFVYWLGDVSDPTTNRTFVYSDSPKIIIAVFERAQYEFLAISEMTQSRPGGGAVRSSADYSRQGGGGGGRKRPSKFRFPGSPESPDEEPDEEPDEFQAPDFEEPFSVPDTPNDTPDDLLVPIPEPATILLIGAALPFALRPRRKTKRNRRPTNLQVSEHAKKQNTKPKKTQLINKY